MGKSLNEIAKELKGAKHIIKAKDESISDVKVQLIYAFNGTGKTRLSREFKELVAPKSDPEAEDTELVSKKIIYYNAFTEDLFYWDNDLVNDIEPKLIIQPNIFTKWIFEDQGQDGRIIENFQHYTDDKLTPHFNAPYTIEDSGREKRIPAFTEVTFSYERGNDERSDNIKISKGEESCFIWSVFYSLLEQVVNVLNVPDVSDRETDQFDHLEYVFIDDPVSSLDDNRLIELAVNLAQLIKESKSDLKFVITTHNPLFYNVLHNEFKKAAFKKYFLKKDEDGEYNLEAQSNDSPFSYHLFLKAEIEKSIKTEGIQKYHFNFLRNILEKTSTFLGYENWAELLPKTEDGKTNPYESRIINISSHSKHSAVEIIELTDNDKRVLAYLLKEIKKNHKFKNWEGDI
ncbi:AAA family ATPase [Sedimentibacter sp.]|uniref:AAA family ATPase n=1 Tax=Sedimentibacter sp. TaxID=1960295 RepID=UPI0028A0D100|nr:AAA family ATPase [Sedimentibacter sp.]